MHPLPLYQWTFSDGLSCTCRFELSGSAERQILTLKYLGKNKLYDTYANKVLKVGTKIVCLQSSASAKIQQTDAEWHREQTWARPNKHIGAKVVWQVQDAEGKSVLHEGTIWGWLPGV